ncbi:hypothetical protein GCK32_022020, partial [Trichostrongylus colubriformis]
IVACLSLVVGSFMVPALTKDDTFDQWRNVFLIYAFVLTLSNTIFIAFARAKPAKWVSNPSKARILPIETSSTLECTSVSATDFSPSENSVAEV